MYRALTEAKLDVNYYGIDFNEKFISELNKRYKGIENVSFIKVDIEEREINLLSSKADIVVNAFNFFEIPNLEKAMRNTANLIKDGGYLLILTIDPITQLLSVSDNQKMFYEYLTEYANKKNRIGYRKRIVIGNKKTNKHYYGILYSLEDYIKEGRNNNLIFQDYTEILNPSRPTPQLYQFMVLKSRHD
ncbi:MAG: methyltransferase domain-containing protein [Bacteroidales bacterium]|nr:methyltransferase domain-containing protein [Bacteroidales bacterium]